MDKRIEALASVVAELQTALNRADRAIANDLGLGSAEDLQVLRLLLADGPLRVGDIARRRASSLATASARLDRLEKHRLLKRERTPEDRRAVVAQLTPGGQRKATKSYSQRLAALAEVAEGFPIEQLRNLVEAIAINTVDPSS